MKIRWYDRVLLVGTSLLIVWLLWALVSLGNKVTTLPDDGHIPVAIVDDEAPTTGPPSRVTPETVPPDWSRCYSDDGTERWVPNLPVPAPGACPETSPTPTTPGTSWFVEAPTTTTSSTEPEPDLGDYASCTQALIVGSPTDPLPEACEPVE
jgi:hypothetical protein